MARYEYALTRTRDYWVIGLNVLTLLSFGSSIVVQIGHAGSDILGVTLQFLGTLFLFASTFLGARYPARNPVLLSDRGIGEQIEPGGRERWVAWSDVTRVERIAPWSRTSWKGGGRDGVRVLSYSGSISVYRDLPEYDSVLAAIERGAQVRG
jgi:hypothetical protein